MKPFHVTRHAALRQESARGTSAAQQPVGHYAPLGAKQLCIYPRLRFNLNNIRYLFVAAFKSTRRPAPV
jgi:hypothetical protein